ncbi:hypothetical protein [Tabrizicola sp.]|uniref:hypothetical protein n=1 Tax=Tabrizicola sp. TaxID=2005166 RepID=UPI00273605C8|nr:hypothetical protein [Tabrizicola sp.]MDP3194383.1 hypothetical protein [Tabrizicola sp.]
MQHPESFDRTHFPRLSLLRASASDFGLQDADAVCLDAILGAAVAFGSEAEEGAFSSIHLAYGQGDDRVKVTVTGTRDEGYQLVLERATSGAKESYVAGLAATTLGGGSAWNVEAAHVAGQQATAGNVLAGIAELRSLVLQEKEVGERLEAVE